MDDKRFNKMYVLKIEDGQIPALKQLCEEFGIADNNVFEHAASFHRIWGICPIGIVYLSHTMALQGIDFESLEELRDFLTNKNKC